MISLDLPTGVFSFSLNSSDEYKISGSLNLANIIAEIPLESENNSNYRRVTPTYYYSIYINKNNEQANLLWSGTETELTNDIIDFEEQNIQSLLNDGIKQTIYVNIDVKTQFTHIYFTSNTISFLAINKKPSKELKEKSGSTIGLVFNNLSENDESTLKEVGFPSFNTSSERFVIPLKYIPADRKIVARYFFNDNGNYNNKTNYFRNYNSSIGKESWDYKYYSESEVTNQKYYTQNKSEWDNLYTPARRADRYYTDANNLRHYVYYSNYGTERGKIYQYHSLRETNPVITWRFFGYLREISNRIYLENDNYLRAYNAPFHPDGTPEGTIGYRPEAYYASEINYYIGYRYDEVTSWDVTNNASIEKSIGNLPDDPVISRYYDGIYYDGWYIKIWKEGEFDIPACSGKYSAFRYYGTRYFLNDTKYEGTHLLGTERWYNSYQLSAEYYIYLYVPEVTESSVARYEQFNRYYANYGNEELSLSNGVKLDVTNHNMQQDWNYSGDDLHAAVYRGGLRFSATPNKYYYIMLESVYVKAPTFTHTYTNTNDIGAEVYYRDEATDNWVRYETVNTWYTESNQIKYKNEILPEIQRVPKLI